MITVAAVSFFFLTIGATFMLLVERVLEGKPDGGISSGASEARYEQAYRNILAELGMPDAEGQIHTPTGKHQSLRLSQGELENHAG